MELGHAAGFGAAEFLEDAADADIVDQGRVEVRVCSEGGAKNVCEEFFGVGIFETALFGAGDGGAEGGEDDDVGGGFVEDLFESSGSGGSGHGGLVMNREQRTPTQILTRVTGSRLLEREEVRKTNSLKREICQRWWLNRSPGECLQFRIGNIQRLKTLPLTSSEQSNSI